MSFDPKEFRDKIEQVLKDFDEVLASKSAVNLLLGTCAVESDFGMYSKQLKGPALGVFQMEPGTYNWLISVYKERYPQLKSWQFHELEKDVEKAVVMARLRYRIVPAQLPLAGDTLALAMYWKKWYNTELGKGTVQKFMAKYNKYVLQV